MKTPRPSFILQARQRLALALVLASVLSGCASTAPTRSAVPWGFDANADAEEVAYEMQACRATGCYPLD